MPMNLLTSIGLSLCAMSAAMLPSSLTAQPPPGMTPTSLNLAGFGIPNGIDDMVVADMDSDGNPDIVCALRANNATARGMVLVIYSNNALSPQGFGPTLAANFTRSIPILASGTTRMRLRTGDIDANGIADVAVYAQSATQVALAMLTDLTGTRTITTTPMLTPPAVGFDDFTLVDIDGNNFLDVAGVTAGTPDRVSVYVNGGTLPLTPAAGSPFGLTTSSGTNRIAIESRDIDVAPGAPTGDLVTRSGPAGAEIMTVALANPTSFYGPVGLLFFSPLNIYATPLASGVAMGDLNGDASADTSVFVPGVSVHGFGNAYNVPGTPPSYSSASTSLNTGAARAVVAIGSLFSALNDVVFGDSTGRVGFLRNFGGGVIGSSTSVHSYPTTPVAPVTALGIRGLTNMGGVAQDIVIATTSASLQIWSQ